MNSSIRSFDPTAHASIRGRLTNRQIDRYAVQGRYGRRLQEDYLAAIRSGSFRGLDAEIRKGKVSEVAYQALASRPTKQPTVPLPTTAKELLKALGL